jgi:hypothetical protein
VVAVIMEPHKGWTCPSPGGLDRRRDVVSSELLPSSATCRSPSGLCSCARAPASVGTCPDGLLLLPHQHFPPLSQAPSSH